MRIIKIDLIELNAPITVYDITVENNHNEQNFLLACGLFVHNSCGGSSHDEVLSGGSATVFINGLPCGRIGDDCSQGDVAAEGSADVFCGG